MARPPPSLHGVPRAGFPRFNGTTRRSEFPTLVPRAFALRSPRDTTSAPPHSFPGRREARRPRRSWSTHGCPTPNDPWKSRDLPGSWRALADVPRSLTPVVRPPWPRRDERCCLPVLTSRRLPQCSVFRGSMTRPICSLSTLRTPDCSGHTQDSLPARWLSFGRTGLPPAGLPTQISGRHRRLPSFQARLLLAHINTRSGSQERVGWIAGPPSPR